MAFSETQVFRELGETLFTPAPEAGGPRGEVTVEVRDGNITINGEMIGEISLGPAASVRGGVVGDLLGQDLRGTVVMRPFIDLSRVAEDFQEELQRQFDTVKEVLRPASVAGLPFPSSPVDFRRRLEQELALESQFLQLRASGFGGLLGAGTVFEDNQEVSFETSTSFTPIMVPSFEGINIREEIAQVDMPQQPLLGRLPTIPLTVAVEPTDAFNKAVEGLTGRILELRFDIPPGEFIEEVSLDQFNCGELFSGIDSLVAETRQQVTGALSRAQTRVNKLEELAVEIQEVSGASFPLEPVQPVQEVEFSIEGVRTTLEDAEDVDLQKLSLDQLSVEEIQGVDQETISDWRERLNSVSTDVTPGTSINGLVSNAQDILERADNIRLSSCFSEFTEAAQDILSDLEELEQLKGRLEDLNGLVSRFLRELGVTVRRPAVPPTPMPELPCEQQFSNIDRRIDNLEDEVAGLTSPDISDVRQLARQSEDIMDDIEAQVDEPDCVSEFTGRIRGANRRLQSLTRRVRIEVGPRERVRQRRQQIEALQGDIDALIEESEELERLIGEIS